MSASGYTIWTVNCNSSDGCKHEGRSDILGVRNAAGVRKALKARGWETDVPSPDGGEPRRLDFCPGHKTVPAHP
jgi:hypothetical protein